MQDTSIDAYHSRSRRTIGQAQCDRIVEYVERAGTATIAEIAKALGMEKSSVSGRRNELIAAGRLVLATERKCSVTNRYVQAVRVPREQQGGLFS
ncbi:helix-turn-helix domain-containing protein [Ralstonia mannitolilytica]|uniref:helix-turn-helix domain-containing protein n=1 Tax=Ralstonia mannitolilytica TaxID=105219 RepID=UPI0026F033A0|nr:helix-turn-helix domain-containing protein [Ralstonia mannitolilytica]